MTQAIILAGGRATRLGPLTAQLNKALVSVGQQPIIAHHLELLRRAGVTDTVVVTSPSSVQQMQDVLSRSHAEMEMNVTFAVQDAPGGPADAVRVGAQSLLSPQDVEVYVVMADTFIDEPLQPIDGLGWVGVGMAPATRSWCYPSRDDGYFTEGVVEAGTLVCNGVYGFESIGRLHAVAAATSADRGSDEAPMAPMLNLYGETTLEVYNSWQDVGDVRALATARRSRFITREHNSLELTKQGVIVKRGSLEELEPELRYYEHLLPNAQTLFPRFLGPTARRDGYMIEYVDMPSLAELYLYWPGLPDMWAGIVEDVLDRLRTDLWGTPFYDEELAVNWHNDMYSHKVWKRLKIWEERGNDVDWTLVERLGGYLASNRPSRLVRGHGDLNFGNILYGLGSGVVKLLDPRGDVYVDLDYELAKLRYSYRDHFSAICHNLFEFRDGVLKFGPSRTDEAAAIDRVLLNLSDPRRITAVEASIFLSATALHNDEQSLALYRQGCQVAREALDDNVWILRG